MKTGNFIDYASNIHFISKYAHVNATINLAKFNPYFTIYIIIMMVWSDWRSIKYTTDSTTYNIECLKWQTKQIPYFSIETK